MTPVNLAISHAIFVSQADTHKFEIDPSAQVAAMEARIVRALQKDGIADLGECLREDFVGIARTFVLAHVRRTAASLGLGGMVAEAAGWINWSDPHEEFVIECEVRCEADEQLLRAALGYCQ